jgi:glycosyltransferase involved in cell wall biosynthesis
VERELGAAVQRQRLRSQGAAFSERCDLLLPWPFEREAVARWSGDADRIFAVSQYMAARAVALGAPPNSILVVPNGVDPVRFSFADSDDARPRLKRRLRFWELKRRSLTFMMVNWNQR